MARFHNPTVLITRPVGASRTFLHALQDAAGPFEPVISPAFEIATTGTAIPDHDAVIFTSRAGVDTAPDGQGKQAWCVGDATAQAAARKGYAPETASGNAEDLVHLILRRSPTDRLVHLRGKNSRGDIAHRLRDRGISCQEVVIYEKAILPPLQDLDAMLRPAEALILPVFSAETVSILAGWNQIPTGGVCVAISEAVAAEAWQINPAQTFVSARPDLSSMTQAVAGLIA